MFRLCIKNLKASARSFASKSSKQEEDAIRGLGIYKADQKILTLNETNFDVSRCIKAVTGGTNLLATTPHRHGTDQVNTQGIKRNLQLMQGICKFGVDPGTFATNPLIRGGGFDSSYGLSKQNKLGRELNSFEIILYMWPRLKTGPYMGFNFKQEQPPELINAYHHLIDKYLIDCMHVFGGGVRGEGQLLDHHGGPYVNWKLEDLATKHKMAFDVREIDWGDKLALIRFIKN